MTLSRPPVFVASLVAFLCSFALGVSIRHGGGRGIGPRRISVELPSHASAQDSAGACVVINFNRVCMCLEPYTRNDCETFSGTHPGTRFTWRPGLSCGAIQRMNLPTCARWGDL
jgi:hypothetical protein